jgi:hypothetical protein
MNAAREWPADRVERRPLCELIPYARNARTHTEVQVAQIAASMREWGWTAPVLVDEDGTIIAGHGRVLAAQRLQWTEAPVMVARGWTPAQVRAYRIADNRLAEQSAWDSDLLAGELDDLRDLSFPLPLIGFEPGELADLIGSPGSGENSSDEGITEEEATGRLADRFLIPPFSVLSARDGWWLERKRAWLALGIRSEEGRGANLLRFSAQANAFQAGAKPYSKTAVHDFDGGNGWEIEGTSVFDPVLTEIAYRWWSPPGGLVLDPFAGGSVRGIVAAKLGRRYVGVDLSASQIEANRQQAAQILANKPANTAVAKPELITDPDTITPIEERGELFLKRDDLFECNGARGGKARALLALLKNAPGAVGIGNRLSPMLSRIARVAEYLNIPFVGHAAGSAKLSQVEEDAQAHGAELVKVKGTNYLSAVKARALRDAQERKWVFVPFGLECTEYFELTKIQTRNIPSETQRIVAAAGSGMTVAAICAGLRERNLRTPILAVRVGVDPEPLLDRWAPKDWRDQISIVQAPSSFEQAETRKVWWGVELDPYYEAKAAAFVQPGDVFWLTAIRTPLSGPAVAETETSSGSAPMPQWIHGDSRDLPALCSETDEADFIFSCPPYTNLERYSEDPRDLSTLDDYADFCSAYAEIIAKACARLKNDRFACFVVGDVRDKAGRLLDLVGDTVRAFQAAGLDYYNDAILVTALGSLPIRAAGIFEKGHRKLGRTHQYVLVFAKGDPRRAAEACGPVEVFIPEGLEMEAEAAGSE